MVAVAAVGIAHADANSFRVTPYVQRPSTNAMTVMWLAQNAGDATLKVWKTGSAEVRSFAAVRRDALSDCVSGLRFEANVNVLEYCLAPELGYYCSKNTKDNTTYRYDAWEMPYTDPWQYRVRIAGLEPDTEYSYSVQMEDASYENRFRTSPSREPSEWRPVKFIYYSDSETEPADNDPVKGLTPDWTVPGQNVNRTYPVRQTEAYATNVCEAVKFGAELIVMAGDLAQKGSKQCDWDEFWRHNAGQLNDPAGSIPIVASPGNHDYYDYGDGGECGLKKYMSYFEYEPNDAGVDEDQRERFHRVDHGPVTFIFLDGNNGDDCATNHTHDTNLSFSRAKNGCRAPDFNPGTLQYAWLERQLKDAQRHSAFTFVVTHHCPFSVGYHGRENYLYDPATGKDITKDRDNLSGRPLRILLPLLHKYGVDGWFAGHDEMMEHFVSNGEEELPDGSRVTHSFGIWDMGIAGDGLRGNKFATDITNEVFRADWGSPEEYDESGSLVYGGKHYGHLEVSVERDVDGAWKATFDPVYLFFTTNSVGRSVYGGKRHYADRVVRKSRRFAAEPTVEPAEPVDQAEVSAYISNYVPTNVPQAVQLTFYDGYQSRNFFWQTDSSVTEGRVWLLKGEYGESDSDLFDRTAADLQLTAEREVAANPPLSRFNAHITGLEPGATYSYRVGSSEGVVYGKFTVREISDTVTIVNLNDFQVKTGPTFYKMVKSAVAAMRSAGGAYRVDAIVNGGDIFDVNGLTAANHVLYGTDVPTAYKNWKWGLAVDAVTPYFPGVPWINVEGNHDIDWAGCSSVDIGKVHVTAMPFCGKWSDGTRQKYQDAVAWAHADLQAAKDAQWKVVCIHWGPYTTGDHGRETGMTDDGAKKSELLRMLTPMFASNHVDIVLQAHDHTFSKTVPYAWDSPGYTDSDADPSVLRLAVRKLLRGGCEYDLNPRGTYYVSAGCSGPRAGEDTMGYSSDTGSYSYKLRKPVIAIGSTCVASAYKDLGAYSSGDFNNQMFGILSIRGKCLEYSFYVAEEDGTSTLVDVVRICKNGSALFIR